MATETGIAEVLLPKNGESEGDAVELKKHVLDELCRETEQEDQGEITKNAVMSGNHGTSEDASFLASLSDQVVSNEADRNGKVHEVLKSSEDSKSGEPKSEVSVDRDIEVVMDRHESIDEGSGALGHKVEAPETSVDKSRDVELSEEQGRVSELFLAKEGTETEKDKDEISLDTVKDEVKDTKKVKSEGPAEEEEIVKTEVPENEIVDLPAVRLLVEQAEVVNGKNTGDSNVESHEHKPNKEVLEELKIAGEEKAAEEDEFSNPILEETKAVTSEEEALKSRDGDDIHVEEHVEKEHSTQREITSPKPESTQDNQKEDETSNEAVAIEKTTKDEVIAEEVNEECKESGPIKSSVKDNEIEDESHGHSTISTREFILEETNNDSPGSNKEYTPSEIVHEKAIEELDTNTIIPCETEKDVESSVSALSAKPEDTKEVSAEEKKVEISRDGAPNSKNDVKSDDQTIKSEEEIIEEVALSTTTESTQQESSENTQEKAAEIIEGDSASQLKDRDQHEVSVEEKKVEISEGEALKKSEDEVQNDEQTGIIGKMVNFFSKTKNDEQTRGIEEEINEEATLSVADSAQEETGKSTQDEEKSDEEILSQLKDRDQHDVSAEEKKVEISMDEALKSGGEVQKDEPLVKVEKEIVEEVTLSTTDSTQEEPSVSPQDKALDEERSHEESVSPLKERDHAEVSVEKKISEGEVQKSDDKVQIDEPSVKLEKDVVEEVACSRDDDKSYEESATEIIVKESENESKHHDPNEVLDDEKKIDVYMDEASKSEGEVQNNEQAMEFEEKSKEVTLSTTDSTQEETGKSTPAEAQNEEKSKEESTAEIIEEESVNKLKEDQDQTEVLVEERKFEISNDEAEKSERDVVNKDQAIKVEEETMEEVPLSTNSTIQEEMTDDKQDKAQDEEKLKESTADIEEESENKLKGEDRTEVSVEEKKDDISIDEAPKSEGEVQSNEKTGLMNKMFGYFSKTESNEPITRVKEEINEEVTVFTTDLTQDKATEINEANESKDQDPTETSVKDGKVEISKDEAPEVEGEVQSTEKTGLMNKMFGYFSKQESEEVKVSTPEFQQEIKEERNSEVINEEAAEKSKDREIEAKIYKEEIVTLETTKATESSPRDLYVEGDIKEEILNGEATEMPKDQEIKAETSSEQVTQVIETPKVIESSVEASLENREESPHEEANPQGQVEEPVELPKHVYDDPDKIEVMTEENKTESSEKVDRDIQQNLEKEVKEVETSKASESVTEDALETLVVAPLEVQHSTGGTLVKEDHETDLADKDIAISYKGEEVDSHQAAKEEAELGEIHESSVLVTSKETETEPSSETTDTEKRAQVYETPKAVECFVETSFEKREEIPQEESERQCLVEDPVKSLKDVNDNPDKIEVTTEEDKTESSEKVDRDIQYLAEFSEVEEVKTSEASESVQCKNAEDSLETLVVARSDETIEGVPLSTTSTTQEEASDDKQDKAQDEEKPREEITAHIIEEESADKSKGQDPTEVSAEENKVEISKDEAPKSEGEVQSNEQPGLMNKMFGYFSKTEKNEPTTRVEEEINEEVIVFTNDHSTQDKAAEIIEEESANKLKEQDPTEVSVKDKVEISKDEAPESEVEVQKNTEHTGLMSKMFGYFSKNESEEVTVPTPEFQQGTPRDYTEEIKEEIKEESKTEIVNEEATEKSKDRETEAETSNEEVGQVFEAPKTIERSVDASSEKQEEDLKEDAEPQSRIEDPIENVAKDTSSVESLKDVYGDPNKIELTTEENKTESSEIVGRDIQNIQKSLETEKSENADHKPDLEKEIMEVETSEASESVQCKNTEDALDTLVVAPSEVQHSTGGTLVKEDDEIDLTYKEIAISSKAEEEDSHRATKEEAESGENLETSVLVTSKDLETEPSSETTDTEKVDESISYDTNKVVERSAEILIEEKKIEDKLSTETKEKESVKIDEPSEKLEELPQVVTVENPEETLETEKKEEKTREVDEVNHSENKQQKLEKCANESKDEDPAEISVDENRTQISKDESPESDREVQASEQTGLIGKMFGFFTKKESEEVTESETEIVNEKAKDREIEVAQASETPIAIECSVDHKADLEKEVVQELEPDIVESRVESSLEKQEKKDDEDILTEVTETTSGDHDITEQASREIDFAEDTKEFQVIAVPSSSLQDENVEKSSKELEKEEYTPKPESLIKEEVAEEETQEEKISLTEAKSDQDVVVEERGLAADLSGEIGLVKEAEPESEEKLERSDIAHEDKILESSVGDVEVHASAEISGEESSLKEVKTVIEEQLEIKSFEAVTEEKDFPSVVNSALLSDSIADEPASEETRSTEPGLKEEKPEDEEKIKSVDIGSLSDIVSEEIVPTDGEEVKSNESKSDSVPTETYLSEAHQDYDHVKISDSAPVDTDVQSDSFSGEAVSETSLLKEDKSMDKELTEIHDIRSQSETVFSTATSREDLGLKEPDPDATSEVVASSYDSFSGEAVSETTLLKEDKSTDKELTEIHDIGSQSETVFPTTTSSKDLGLKEPDPDATPEEVASSYDSASVEIPGEEEERVKSNDTVPEVKFDLDDRVKTSDIALVETDVQHVSEGTSFRIPKEESELSSEDVIVTRDRDIETRSNSASDEVGLKEDDKPIYNEEQTGQEREEGIFPITRFSETRLDDYSEESDPSKELLMKLSKQEDDSKVVSNVNEETEELNKQPEIISRDTIPTKVHEGTVEEGIESAEIDESIKSEEVFEERNSSQILAEVKETNPNELTSDSLIKEYVTEKNIESVTIVTEPKEENESIVLEERSFGFAPETETKNTVEEAKLAPDTEVIDAISPIPAVELHETSEAKEEVNESMKLRDMEPELDEATVGSHGVGKDEVVADRDLPVRVSAEPIQVPLEEESESEIASTVQKVAEEEYEETEILNDEKTEDSLAEETKVKEEPEESDVTEVEIIENSGSQSLPLEEQEAGIATVIKEVKVLPETGSEDKDNAKSSHVVDEVVTDRDLPVGILTEPIRDSPSTLVTEDSESEILEDKKTRDSLAEETKAKQEPEEQDVGTISTKVHEGSVEEGIESAKIEESIKSEEVFEEKTCSQILAEVKEINSTELTSDSPVEEYVAKKEESITVLAEPKEDNESVVLEERSFSLAPETENKNIIEEVKLDSDIELDEAAEGSHVVGKDEVITDRDLRIGVSTEPIQVLPEEDSKSEIASTVRKLEEEEDESKKETEILDDEKKRDSLETELAEETKAKEEPEESHVTEVEIIENSGSRSLPLEEQEAGIATTIKEVKVSEEAESEVKEDIAKSSQVVDEVVTDRDLPVGFSMEPIQDSPSTLIAKDSDSEIIEDAKTKDSFADETKAKQEAEEQDVVVATTMIKQVSAEDFKADSDVKVSEEAVLEVNDAVKPLCEKEETSLDEKGLAISTKEVPETEFLSIAEKEDEGEAKKLEISEGPKVIREVETEKDHSPTEENKATGTREERDFVSDKSGSPEPKTSIEDVQFIEDHLKIATTDEKQELSSENRQVKSRDTETPTKLEETSQRDLKPELVSQSGLVESPKEDTEHKKSEHSTDHGTEEMKKKTKKKEGENDEHNEEEEEEEEDEEDHDASTVQSSKDGETKASKKKSHGLFSGVGSKVKHSISKVKKVITGKSSNNTKDAAAK